MLRWLKPNEWDACGYNYDENDGKALLSRDPLRRFEDIPADYKSTHIHSLDESDTISGRIISVINNIRNRHPSTEQGDIAIIFIDRGQYIYEAISRLRLDIKQQLNWDSNVSFESKSRQMDKLFISNINNAKGLEFPFVICFARKLQRHPSFRNALYTMMARSFLESHLMLSHFAEKEITTQVTNGLTGLTQNNNLCVRIPTPEEINNQNDFIVLEDGFSIEKIVKDYCIPRSASPRLIAKVISSVTKIIEDIDDYSESYLMKLIELEYERNKIL